MSSKHIIRTVIAALCFFILMPSLALAEMQDMEGFKDPQLFTRMPGFAGVDIKLAEFEKHEFFVGTTVENLEGRYSWHRYELDPASGRKVSNLQVIRNFQNAAKKLGGRVVFSEDDQPSPRSTVVIKKPNMEIWVQIYATANTYYELTIVEKETMAQDVTANPMLDTIKQTGKVTLYINFDTGKANIKSESFPVIDQIAAMLNSDPSLKIFVDGHTDNTGNAEGNQKLSEMRAESVKTALVDKGIDGSRLSARGFGRSKPIADNNSDAGRAKNRRVELVKR